jgi:hypothetical protein
MAEPMTTPNQAVEGSVAADPFAPLCFTAYERVYFRDDVFDAVKAEETARLAALQHAVRRMPCECVYGDELDAGHNHLVIKCARCQALADSKEKG